MNRIVPSLLALVLILLLGCATGGSRTAAPSAANTESPADEARDGPGPPESSRVPETESTEESESRGEDTENAEEDGNEKEKKRKRVVLDTVYDDARVGQDQSQQIEAELGIITDEALNRYVTSVALRLLRHAPSRPFDYEFRIIDQTVPNAFALPGGKIYVSRGLLTLATSEDELAGVLGHEITHAAERHASARLEYNRRLNPFSIGFLRAARVAAYGREQERDADRGGQLLAAAAGYDPSGIAQFLRKLDAAERYEVGWSRLPSFFATHPTSPERAAIALDRASGLDWTSSPAIAGESDDAYFRKIDGMILGDDPAGGLFDEENRFVHPELGFALRFPEAWLTMNSPQAVRAISPSRDAQAELTLAGPADEPLDAIVDDFVANEFEGMTIRVTERREIQIGELPAVRIEGRVMSPIGPLAAHMTFVQHEKLVYRLTLLSFANTGIKYRGRARAFAHSFRPLDEDGMRSLEVTRLRIARALEDETLQELSIRTRNELEVVFTGVLNGLFASTPLERRTPVKIGIKEPYLPQPEEREEPGAAGEDAPPEDDASSSGTEPRSAERPGDASD